MLQRVCPELMGMKNVLVFNDEGHHCYATKPEESEERTFKGDERKEAEKNQEAARVWLRGLQALQSRLGISRVIDLSATPFFLRGSGYAEGTLFPWTMSDFSLMDAIECGIVKLPRVPVADNLPATDTLVFRNLWEHIGKRMARTRNALELPNELQTALHALYGHYQKTFDEWRKADIETPPCFIVVCNNQTTSKLLYDYIAGVQTENEAGETTVQNGRLPLFRNFERGKPLARPNTLLIDSERLESGEALDGGRRGRFAGEGRWHGARPSVRSTTPKFALTAAECRNVRREANEEAHMTALLTVSDQKEQLSLAYVNALAACAGFATSVPVPDRDSVDLHVRAGGPIRPALDLQLKATAALQRSQAGFVSFQLKIKNYNDLRIETRIPRLLVVLELPADESLWMTVTDEELVLRRRAYWLSLQQGFSERSGQQTVTVRIPEGNLLDVDVLRDLMEQSIGAEESDEGQHSRRGRSASGDASGASCLRPGRWVECAGAVP